MQAISHKNEGERKDELENVTRLRRVVCLHLETRPLANHRTVLSRLIDKGSRMTLMTQVQNLNTLTSASYGGHAVCSGD